MASMFTDPPSPVDEHPLNVHVSNVMLDIDIVPPYPIFTQPPDPLLAKQFVTSTELKTTLPSALPLYAKSNAPPRDEWHPDAVTLVTLNALVGDAPEALVDTAPPFFIA